MLAKPEMGRKEAKRRLATIFTGAACTTIQGDGKGASTWTDAKPQGVIRRSDAAARGLGTVASSASAIPPDSSSMGAMGREEMRASPVHH
jgi:hypothetical protein